MPLQGAHYDTEQQHNASADTDPVAGHICGLCSKAFDRRDLRDRHKRRCIQSAGKVRLSKRKSCLACAQKKLRCTFDKPACTRCTEANITCEYPAKVIQQSHLSDPETVQPTSTRASLESYGQQHQQQFHSQQSARSRNSIEPLMPIKTALPATSEDVPTQRTMLQSQPWSASASRMEGIEGMNTSTSSGDDLLFHTLDDWPLLSTDQLNLSEPFSFHDEHLSTLSKNPVTPWFPYPQDPHSDIFPTALYAANPLQEPALPNFGLEPLSSGNEAFDVFPSYSDLPLVSTPNLSSLGGDGSSSSVLSAPDKYGSPPSLTASRTSVSRSTSSIGGSANGDAKAGTSEFGDGFVLNSPQLDADEVSDGQDLISVIRSYPRLMLRNDFWSPCIHHRLYRCSKSGMAESLGIALVCVSSHMSAVASSNEFVRNMVDRQRERLVSEFSTPGTSPETSLAALHAMCVYQIIDLLDWEPLEPDSRVTAGAERGGVEGGAKSGFGAAELHQSFLLKMTRRLCTTYSDAMSSTGKYARDWSQWTFAESLRRTVFLVNIINVLAAKVRKIHEEYYEPLNDELILDTCLPASEPVWKACNAEQWGRAADDVRQGLWEDGAKKYTLRELLRAEETGVSVNEKVFSPLSRVILACGRMQFGPDEVREWK